jgi:hypothetical protein
MRKRDAEKAAKKLIKKLMAEISDGGLKKPFDTVEFILSSEDKMRIMVKTLLELDLMECHFNGDMEEAPFFDCAMIIAQQYFWKK